MLFAALILALGVAYLDATYRIIPNGACLILALLGIALQALRFMAGLYPHLSQVLGAMPLTYNVAQQLPNPLVCLASALVFLVLGVVFESLVRSLTSKPGMGMGDIKYFAAWACLLGWYVLPALALACAFGATWALATKQRTFALGPWLSLSFFALVLLLLFFPRATLIVA